MSDPKTHPSSDGPEAKQNSLPVCNDNDARWTLLVSEALAHAANGNWASYRHSRFLMADFLRRESRWKASLSMYLWVCYLDLNGPQDTGGAKGADAFCPSAPWARLAPGPLSFAREIRERLGLGLEEIQQLFREVAEKEHHNLQLPLPVDEAWAILRPEMLSSPVEPGYYHGRHYTAYVDEVKDLKREGDLIGAERLLLGLIEAVETEAKKNHWAVAPWYYEQLAIIYRKQKESTKEAATLERYVAQLRAPWVRSPTSDLPGPLEERLAKLKTRMKESLARFSDSTSLKSE